MDSNSPLAFMLRKPERTSEYSSRPCSPMSRSCPVDESLFLSSTFLIVSRYLAHLFFLFAHQYGLYSSRHRVELVLLIFFPVGSQPQDTSSATYHFHTVLYRYSIW